MLSITQMANLAAASSSAAMAPKLHLNNLNYPLHQKLNRKKKEKM